MDLHIHQLAIGGLLIAIIFLWSFTKDARRNNIIKGKKLLAPEPQGAWPIVGHLHLFGTNSIIHQILGAMADKYGPIFFIRLGFRRVVVISSKEAVKECFTVNDKVLSTRPKSLAAEVMGYNYAVMGLAPYGPYWRSVRKLAAIELLSNHRLEILKHVRDTETNLFIKELYEQWLVGKSSGSSPVQVLDMIQKFGDLTMNIVGGMIAGKKYFGAASSCSREESRRCQKALADFLRLTGLFTVSDAVPSLGWLDTVLGYKNKMKQTAREIDYLLGKWVDEHKQKRLMGIIGDEEQDFIHIMLSALGNNDQVMSQDEIDRTIKATILTLILGGNETTSNSLSWATSLLLNNCNVLKKAQNELDLHVGRYRKVQESDIKDLVYLQAIVKETLRLYPPVPLAVPHEAMEDCTIAGFHVAAGTGLLVNIWKLQRDPCIWSDPLKFKPERFLDESNHVDVKGQDFEIIPFGSGRRMCPAATFALQVMNLTLARLLHGFDLETVSNASVDMSESSGLSCYKLTPLEVILTPRLSSEFYMY